MASHWILHRDQDGAADAAKAFAGSMARPTSEGASPAGDKGSRAAARGGAGERATAHSAASTTPADDDNGSGARPAENAAPKRTRAKPAAKRVRSGGAAG